MVEKQRISVFIDAEYVNKSAKSLKDKPYGIDIPLRNINWDNLVKYAAKTSVPQHVCYYTAALSPEENMRTYNEQVRYLETLPRIFETKLGKMVKIRDCWVQKGVDTQMTIDIITEECDIVVLITGDSDLAPAVKKSIESGKKVFLVTFSRNGGQTPKDFIDLCSSHNVIDYRTGKNLGIWN